MKMSFLGFTALVSLVCAVTAVTAADNNDAGLPAAAASAQASGADKSLEVLIETDGTNFKGISKKVRGKKAPELSRQILRKGFYYIEAANASGRALRVQSMPDPTEVLYDYPDPAQSGSPVVAGPQKSRGQVLKGGKIKLPKAQFLLRLPYDADIRTLKIHSIKNSPAAADPAKERRMIGVQSAAQAPSSSDRELKATLDLGAIPEAP